MSEKHNGLLRDQEAASLKRPTHKLTGSELQHRGINSESASNIWRGNELMLQGDARGAGVRAALSGTEVLASTIVPLLSPPPTQTADADEYQICTLH